MVKQIAGIITDGHLDGVHEVDFEGPVVMSVLEPILTRLPEVAGAVAHSCGAEPLLPEILCDCGSEIRLTAVNQNSVNRREDVLS